MGRVRRLTLVLVFLGGAAWAEPIHLAAQKGDVETLSRLLADGVPVDLPSTRDTSEQGVSPLIAAVKWRRAEAVDLLLAAGADPDLAPVEDRLAETPLMLAAKTGHMGIIDALLAAGADPNFATLAGTPLHSARLVRRDAVAERLLDAGALPQLTVRPIADRLGTADLARGGRIVTGRCALCHGDPADPGRLRRDRGAPRLDAVAGMPKAAQPEARYSPALAALGGTWTVDELNSFLANPGAFVPGTAMWGVSIADERDRIDIIGYLESLGRAPAE